MSWSVRPGVTGVVIAAGLIVFAAAGPAVADPAMAGFVWAAALGVLIVGAVWPFLVVWSVRVDATRPLDGHVELASRVTRVGEQTAIGVHVSLRIGDVRLGWSGGGGADAIVVPPGSALDVRVPMVLRRRGRFDRLFLTVSSDGPFGVLTASRVVVVEPARPLLSGPPARPLPVLDVPDAPSDGDSVVAAVGHGGDTTRTVRPYVTGDPAHLVHWPSTARTGTIVVREMEPPASRSVAVVVDLGVDHVVSKSAPASAASPVLVMPTVPPSAAEQAVEDVVAAAGAAVISLRSRGVRVVLCTSNADAAGPSSLCVEAGDEDDVLIRLAGAVPGPPGKEPSGWPVLRFNVDGERG